MSEPFDELARDEHDAVTEGWIRLAPGVRVRSSDVRLQFSRSSGPGGQNVNKLNTKAELWLPLHAIEGLNERALERLKRLAGRRLTLANELHLTDESSRSQQQNRERVHERLRELIVQSLHEPKPRKKTRPSKAAKRRRLEGKKRRSEIKARRRGDVGG